MVFCMETEHPRRGRLASTGVWLLGSAASSETPLDSDPTLTAFGRFFRPRFQGNRISGGLPAVGETIVVPR